MHDGQHIAGIILARMGSTRLPGKMLLPFAGGTVLSTVIERLRACRTVDEWILATTEDPADDPIAAAGAALGLRVTRGSTEDVVARMGQAVEELDESPDVVVRGCADNPLVMPSIVDAGVRELVTRGCDLVSPFEHATLPFGFGLVAMTRACLARIDAEAEAPSYREHVENYCFEHPERFDVRFQVSAPGEEYPELCATLDHEVDLVRLKRLGALIGDVPLEAQPRELIARLRSQSVWVEGRSTGELGAAQLVLAVEEPDGDPELGAAVVDTFLWCGEQRRGLRYARSTAPVFIDREPVRAEESARAFLLRIADEALPVLLAGPARPLVEPAAEGARDKEVRPAARVGFQAPEHAHFPPQVVLDLAGEAGGLDLLGQLLPELHEHATTQVVVPDSEDAQAIAALATEQLGQARVLRGLGARPHRGDGFAEVVVTPQGSLRVGAAQTAAGTGIGRFWRSPAARRERATEANASGGGRVAICQPHYVPWIGYFEMIDRVDTFVLFDDVDFIKREWKNRNRVRQGPRSEDTRWLSVPITRSDQRGTPIHRARIGQGAWRQEHLDAFDFAYRKAPFYAEAWALLAEGLAGQDATLGALNARLIGGICGYLGITTRLVHSSDLAVQGRKTERLLAVCRALGATSYLANNGSATYLEPDRFEQAGITCAFQDYAHPDYNQPYDGASQPFLSHLSILDLIASVGPEALMVVRAGRPQHA